MLSRLSYPQKLFLRIHNPSRQRARLVHHQRQRRIATSESQYHMRSLFENADSESYAQLRRQCSLLLRLGPLLRNPDESLPVGKLPLLRPWCIRVQSLQPATSSAGGGTGAFASNDDRNSRRSRWRYFNDYVCPTCNAYHRASQLQTLPRLVQQLLARHLLSRCQRHSHCHAYAILLGPAIHLIHGKHLASIQSGLVGHRLCKGSAIFYEHRVGAWLYGL